MTDRLAELRAQIAALDAELLELVARRLALAEAVGQTKRESGLPVRSFGTEAEVLGRFREAASAHGVETEVAERLARFLIGASVRRQEEVRPAKSDRAQRMLIVGGAGKMGHWLCTFFLGQGHRVTVLDPAGAVPGCAHATSLADAVADADAVLVATPLSQGAATTREILALEPRALVAEILSLQSHILEDLRAGAKRGLRVATCTRCSAPT